MRMMFSRSNWPMRKLASKAHARFDMDFDEILADVAIIPPEPGWADTSRADQYTINVSTL